MQFILSFALLWPFACAFGPGGPKVSLRHGATALKVPPNQIFFKERRSNLGQHQWP
jgi:hypothetical protein